MTTEMNPQSPYSFESPFGRQQAPYLHLSARAVELVLPACGEGWHVEIDGAAKEFAASESAVRVDIPSPFARATATTAGGQAFAFAGVVDGVMAFPARHEPTREFLVPRGTVVEPAELLRRDSAWAGWAAVRVPSEQPVVLHVPFQPAVEVDAVAPTCFTWNTAAATEVEDTLTVDDEPVWSTSPQLIAHEPVTVELIYVSPQGEREPVHEEEVDPGIYDLFAADTYDDPWVGRYEVLVYTDAAEGRREVASRYFTIAEGLVNRISNQGPRGTHFRSVDATGELSPYSYTLASATKKPLNFTKGSQQIGTVAYAHESVSTDTGYEAHFRVVPQAITLRYAYAGQQAQEHRTAHTILAGQLAADSALTVHAPVGLPLAKFVSIDKSAKIRDLVKAGGSTQARTSLSMSAAQVREALGKNSSFELYVLWSTLSYQDYLAGLSPQELREHEAQDPQRRQTEYEVTAAKDLIYAALGTVRKAPVAVRGALAKGGSESGQIIVEWAEGEYAQLHAQGKVRALAWPMTAPTGQPHVLTATEQGFAAPNFDAGVSGSQANSVPIVMDLRPVGHGTDLEVPEVPGAHSLIVERGEAAVVDTPEPAAHVAALREIGNRSKNAKLEAYLAALRQQLATGQDALDSCPLDMFIDAGAHVQPGSIAAAHLEHDDRTQPLLVNAALSSEPSTDPRIVALRECFRADIALHRLYMVRELHGAARQLAAGLSGTHTSVAHTLIALDMLAGSDSMPVAGSTTFKAAHMVPYISYVFALASRAIAHGKADAAALELVQQSSARLAAIARLAPQLVRFDLITAEGLSR